MRRSPLMWLLFAVSMHVLGLTGIADSEERLRAGTKDLSVSGGYSISHNIAHFKDVETVEGFHLLPHFGYVITDQHGAGWVRGNFELLAEPTLIHLAASNSATVVGLSVLGRWVFATGPVARPYFEVGLGVLGGRVNLRETNCEANFIIEAGPGVLLFLSEATTVTVGYRFHHISNAGACTQNLGVNSSLFTLGISHFFR